MEQNSLDFIIQKANEWEEEDLIEKDSAKSEFGANNNAVVQEGGQTSAAAAQFLGDAHLDNEDESDGEFEPVHLAVVETAGAVSPMNKKPRPSRTYNNNEGAVSAVSLLPLNKYQIGQNITAFYEGNRANRTYPGTIQSINLDGTYDVLYEDGDIDYALPESAIKSILPSDAIATPGVGMGVGRKPTQRQSDGIHINIGDPSADAAAMAGGDINKDGNTTASFSLLLGSF